MDPRDTRRLDPEEGAAALLDVIGDISGVVASGDLAGFEDVFRQMETIVGATGAEVPGFDGKIEMLRRMTADQRARFDAVDAALWAGAFARAQELMDAGGVDMAAFLELDGTDPGEFEEDDDPDGDETEAVDLSALADFLDLDPGEPAPPDLYADLAAGVPGAAEALIAAGTDLNTPCGEGGHTALLAALDAPGRRAETIAALIDAGAEATVIHGLFGDNAISWSMGYNHPETVDEDSELSLFSVLVSEGADPDHVVPGQMAALHRGILQTSTPGVEALLTIGADPDQPLPDSFEPARLAGATPLMLAAPKPDLFRRLLDHGADGFAPDACGRDQLAFLEAEAGAARDRIDPDDPWTAEFAQGLADSVEMLRAHRAG